MLTWLWVLQCRDSRPRPARRPGAASRTAKRLPRASRIVWSLEEEEAITLTDVITGLRNAFDRDRISKNFYEKFKAQHEAFAAFIEGLTAASDKTRYVADAQPADVRLFHSEEGLSGWRRELSCQADGLCGAAAGKGKFHSFYRQFLRRLFHEGLGQAKGERNPELSRLIGDVPYLNGGLFDVHDLEATHPSIDIPDEAFERLFAFFDAWDWHLDDRLLASGKKFIPDVLGYILEKYINQKQMGAYYTKEDITGYIAKNTVVPHLIEQARERCKVAFEGEASMWNLLQADPDHYIYPAMKTGVIDAAGNLVPNQPCRTSCAQRARRIPRRATSVSLHWGEAVFRTATGEQYVADQDWRTGNAAVVIWWRSTGWRRGEEC